LAQLSIEYGATAKQSFGVNLLYSIDKFATDHDTNHNRQHIGGDANLFYKYQLFRNEKLAISIKPSVQFSTYNFINSCKQIDMAVFAGFSKNKKNGTSLFHEFGFSLIKYFNDVKRNKFGYTVSTLDGIKTKNGIIITNYFQYTENKLKNLAYNKTKYEQFSIGKEFNSKKLIPYNFTAQIGYFWKITKLGKEFTMSGPILSAWLSI
jgi:hypothetical protein